MYICISIYSAASSSYLCSLYLSLSLSLSIYIYMRRTKCDPLHLSEAERQLKHSGSCCT